jgi:hypothetical protein
LTQSFRFPTIGYEGKIKRDKRQLQNSCCTLSVEGGNAIEWLKLQEIQRRPSWAKGGWNEKKLDADGELPHGREFNWTCGICAERGS